MSPIKPLSVTLIILLFCTINNNAHAQLWRYLNDSPEKEKAAEKALEKEAYSVVTKNTVAYGDTFSYRIMNYAIRSFDEQASTITLWEKPFDGHVFHIDSPNDSLEIYDFSSLARVHILSSNLLEIVYSPRGGSDDGYDNVLILGLNKGKFCMVMEILAIHEFDGPGEYGLYNLHLKLMGQNVDNYQLGINVRELLQSNGKSRKSYDRSSDFVLKYDNNQHIFYNEIKPMNFTVDIWDRVSNQTVPRDIAGAYPAIKLGKYEYCFFEGMWYSYDKNVSNGKYYLVPNTEHAHVD